MPLLHDHAAQADHAHRTVVGKPRARRRRCDPVGDHEHPTVGGVAVAQELGRARADRDHRVGQVELEALECRLRRAGEAPPGSGEEPGIGGVRAREVLGEHRGTDRPPCGHGEQEAPVERQQQETPLNIKVVINFAPQDAASATLQPLDTNALISILRNIGREPRIGKFSIIAYNMQSQKVIYRQEGASQIDFPAIGKALNSVNLGTVDLKRLSQKHGDSEFLSTLITKELKEDSQPADAVIFLQF